MSESASTTEFIRQYLGMHVQVMEQNGRFQKRHGFYNLHHFLLERGQDFEFTPLPEGVPYETPQQCFANSYHCVEDDPERFVYCEGVGHAFLVTDHAWVWDREYKRVLDLTWRHDWEHPPLAYMGIPLKWEYAERINRERQFYGVLDNWQDKWPILALDPSEYLEPLD